jgi:hypothetical protein
VHAPLRSEITARKIKRWNRSIKQLETTRAATNVADEELLFQRNVRVVRNDRLVVEFQVAGG